MTNNNDQQLLCQVNARAVICLGCSQRAVITLEWYSNIVVAPSTLARLHSMGQQEQEQVVGNEMFTLCLYCLRRERYIPVWDNATRLPRWEAVETFPGVSENAPG